MNWPRLPRARKRPRPGSTMVDALRASDAWIEGLSIVTEDSQGTVVGHALLIRCHVRGTPALALPPAPCSRASNRVGPARRPSAGSTRRGLRPRPASRPSRERPPNRRSSGSPRPRVWDPAELRGAGRGRDGASPRPRRGDPARHHCVPGSIRPLNETPSWDDARERCGGRRRLLQPLR